MRKGLRCDIVRREEQDCSNGGISSRYRRVTLVGDDIQGPFEVRPDAPAVKLVRRKIAGRDYVHAEPADEPTKPGHTSYMMGGTFILC